MGSMGFQRVKNKNDECMALFLLSFPSIKKSCDFNFIVFGGKQKKKIELIENEQKERT